MPRILSPGATTPYRVRRDAPSEFQKIPLLARVAPSVERLYWYVDGSLVGAAPPGRSLFVMPEQGSHRLVVVDDSGRSDGLTYRVE
jgi:penicillin-binding protein 1C